MPMLAERRRKSKWTLNPGRRALWTNGDSAGLKFGQGLMEKMGWKVGQGLGLKEQGMAEPLRISMKKDSKGIGFKDTDSIEWVQQQHDFNKLLEKLSSSNKKLDNMCNDAETLKTRSSLEEKSKLSKTRVHYQKFTRGKDLTKYSEKDLECILGNNKDLFKGVIEDKDSDSCAKPETDQYIINAGSMADYFSKKMQKRQILGISNSSQDSHKQEALIDFQAYDGEPEVINSEKKKKKRVREKEMKSSKEFVDGENSEKDHEDQNSPDTADDKTLDDNRRGRHRRNKYSGEASIEGCLQGSHDEKNEGKCDKEAENLYAETFNGNNSDCKYLKKHKKKRKSVREIGESNLEHTSQLENEEVIDCKKRKLDDESVEHSKRSKSQKKGKKKVDAIETENNLGNFSQLEDEEIGLREAELVNDGDELRERESKHRKKVKRKGRVKSIENNSIYVSQLQNDCKRTKIDEIENSEMSKTRKRGKRKETAREMGKNSDCDNPIENEKAIGFRERQMDSISYEVHLGDVSKPRKKERKERVEEIGNEVIHNECIDSESHSKKKKRSRKEESTVEENGTKRGDLHGNTANSVYDSQETMRKEKEAITSDITQTNGIKKNKTKKSEKDNCDPGVGEKESNEKPPKNAAHSSFYKAEVLMKGSAYIHSNPNKILDLICCTNIDAFQGSNLKQIKGYGIVRYINDSSVPK